MSRTRHNLQTFSGILVPEDGQLTNGLHARSTHTLSAGLPAALLLSGLVFLPLQFVKISIAQPVHLWLLVALSVLTLTNNLRLKTMEIWVFLLFITATLFATFGTNYNRIKDLDQLIKFMAVYPGCFIVGRSLGLYYFKRPLPFGWLALGGFFILECLVHFAKVPYIWQPVPFMESHGSLYGTFKERNWLALYFFCAAYLLFLKEKSNVRAAIGFFLICLIVTVLSGSKSILVAFAIAISLQIPGKYHIKLFILILSVILYFYQFSGQFSEQAVQVRLQTERGLALQESIRLLHENFLGYGLGFVEAHFSTLDFAIRGLGAGVNSVFSAPVDLAIIAGAAGIIFWIVFFVGFGLRSIKLLAPLAAWSLINPLQQSEIYYLFSGIIVSWGLIGAGVLRRARHPPLEFSKRTGFRNTTSTET
jgi:hypothetical protein